MTAPRWIFGEDPTDRTEYAVHTVRPMFVARVHDADPEFAVLGDLVLALNDGTQFEIVCVLDGSSRSDFTADLVRDASLAWEMYDALLLDTMDEEDGHD